jgi:hypothetical protein
MFVDVVAQGICRVPPQATAHDALHIFLPRPRYLHLNINVLTFSDDDRIWDMLQALAQLPFVLPCLDRTLADPLQTRILFLELETDFGDPIQVIQYRLAWCLSPEVQTDVVKTPTSKIDPGLLAAIGAAADGIFFVDPALDKPGGLPFVKKIGRLVPKDWPSFADCTSLSLLGFGP